jgi:hypothetical protein
MVGPKWFSLPSLMSQLQQLKPTGPIVGWRHAYIADTIIPFYLGSEGIFTASDKVGIPSGIRYVSKVTKLWLNVLCKRFYSSRMYDTIFILRD